MRYDATKDLAPVAPVAVSPFVLVGAATCRPGHRRAGRAARSQPGKLTYGTDGVGTSLHVTATMITQQAGLDMVHVPYKSGPQVLTDVAGGTVDLAVLPLALAQPIVKENKVRAYGVTSRQRSEAMPGTPSLAETRELAGFDVDSWIGLLAPAAIDPAVTARLAKEVAAVLADPEVIRQLALGGMKPMLMTPTDFAAYLARERKSLAATVSAGNIKVE